jgi:outer membrane protein
MKFAPVLLFVLVALGAAAQTTGTQKVGYADWDYIFAQMPEYKQIEASMKTHGDQLQNQMKAKTQEYESKLDYYQKNAATMVDAVRKDKEAELTQLQQNIQKFQQDAQTSFEKKRSDLMQPVFTKVGKAIDEVAKENGYTFVINPQLVGGGDILLYQDSKFDISALVLKKMGITATASAQPK